MMRPSKRRRWLWLSFALAAVVGVAYLALLVLVPYSGVARAVVWGTASADDLRKFPAREVSAAPPAFSFTHAPETPERLFGDLRYTPEGDSTPLPFEAFLEASGTNAFLVIRDDALLYERYYNGADEKTLLTSFSVAKSFLSTLVGVAVSEGYIRSVDDPVTRYLPELAERDPRFGQVTLRHLLDMRSGLRYEERGLPWSDDALTYFSPDLRALALTRTEVVRPPGEVFLYNNYNPLLLGLVLKRTTGRSVAKYLEEKLWRPLGMEGAGSWSLDSARHGFEKMESGLNVRARDYAKFGRLYLHGGLWEGQQVVPRGWAAASLRGESTGYPAWDYGLFWWSRPRTEGASYVAARGNLGQFIVVVPACDLVLVRLGERFGFDDWTGVFDDLTDRLCTRR